MPAVLTTFTSSAWNAGGSIMTFYFPIGLFLVIAAALFLQLTRPHVVPGRKPLKLARSGPAVAAPAEGQPTAATEAEPEVPAPAE